MADDCDALGFKMDCGKAFEQLYGKAIHDYEELDKIINDVTDIYLLGSAIYSRWRYFNHWAYTGEGFGKYEKSQTKNYRIQKAVAENVLSKIATYFSDEYDEIFATDIGIWEMEITNTEGKAYKFRGSLCADFEVDGVDLSDLIRDSLQIDDLYVFDGRFKKDKVNRITVDYHRVTKIK